MAKWLRCSVVHLKSTHASHHCTKVYYEHKACAPPWNCWVVPIKWYFETWEAVQLLFCEPLLKEQSWPRSYEPAQNYNSYLDSQRLLWLIANKSSLVLPWISTLIHPLIALHKSNANFLHAPRTQAITQESPQAMKHEWGLLHVM